MLTYLKMEMEIHSSRTIEYKVLYKLIHQLLVKKCKCFNCYKHFYLPSSKTTVMSLGLPFLSDFAYITFYSGSQTGESLKYQINRDITLNFFVEIMICHPHKDG